ERDVDQGEQLVDGDLAITPTITDAQLCRGGDTCPPEATDYGVQAATQRFSICLSNRAAGPRPGARAQRPSTGDDRAGEVIRATPLRQHRPGQQKAEHRTAGKA